MLGVGLLASACMPPRTQPGDFFRLEPESAAHRAMQTRHFETRSFDELLAASAAVLQDLGYQITESERSIGFLRGVKERSAREYGQEINRGLVVFFSSLGIILGANTMYVPPVDLQQQINASLIARPAERAAAAGDAEAAADAEAAGDSEAVGDAEAAEDAESKIEVRVFFYRIIWQGSGSIGDEQIPPGLQRMEIVRDPEVYQQFFARLSKAIFLEAQKI